MTKEALKGTQCHDVVLVADGKPESSNTPKCWVKINTFYLFESDRESLQDSNQWLNDNHMLCAQRLLQRQFPQLGGLKPTSLQLVGPLKPFPSESQSLQILHVNRDHWIAVSTVGCTADTDDSEDIIVFDSKYSSLSMGTKLVLSQLIHTDKPSFNVKIASVSKQSGSADCGLYAIAYVTSLHLVSTLHYVYLSNQP